MLNRLKNYAIVLASGKGERFSSSLPKQFTKIAGKTILEYSVDIFENNKLIDEIIVVVTLEYLDKAKELLKNYKKVSQILKGGQTRKDSSYIGISAIKDSEANVLIHDCARPLLSQEILDKCIEALSFNNAITVACFLTDTIVEVDGNLIKNIPQRNFYKNVQTPQGFKLSLIKKAHELSKNDDNFTDDCALILKHNLSDVSIVEGDINNIKITYPKDLFVAEKIINSGGKNE